LSVVNNNNEPKGNRMTKKCMAGIDLPSNNLFCAMVDRDGKRVLEKKLPCDLASVLAALKPFKKRLEKIAVESTYNWYGLVDGLQDHGYTVVLAHPAAMQQYDGLKHADDKSDGFFLAEMLRLDMPPTGNICARAVRPVRDLLRRRTGLVPKRTSLILSLKSLPPRRTGRDLGTGRIKAMEPKEAEKLFEHPADRLITRLDLQLVEPLGQSLEQIEAAVLAQVKGLPNYQVLQTMPGVGKILGWTITLETVDPQRFASPGDYASCCRCVDSRRLSNGKKKGQNNAKCGKAHLAWAFVEAAQFARRHDDRCRKFHDRKSAQVNGIVAAKALACKLAKAAWHRMSHHTHDDAGRMFPGAKP
jgi:transposase